jgi:FkbM family methyltransferase
LINLIKKLYYEKYTKKSYSISNVDLIIDRMFSKVEKGFFIDLGCNHPIKFNNTYLLYKRGWRGINIDLDPKNIRLFDLERPNEINICKCVSSDNSEKDLFFFHSGSPINSLEKKTTKDKSNFSLKKIETFTLNSILEDYKIQHIDYFNLDVEGHELDVLNNFNIQKYKPKVISVEFIDFQMNELEFRNNNIDRILKSELYKYFTSNNYHFVNWTHADLIFVHETFRD